MDVIRTQKGTDYVNSLITSKSSYDSLTKTQRHDWVVLSGFREGVEDSVEEIIIDNENETWGVTNDGLRRSIRRLFEAGYLEEV